MRLTRDRTLQRAGSASIEPPRPPRTDDEAGGDSVAKTGTTCVGLTTADGVVLATDQRASKGGSFVVNKSVQKIEQIHSTAASTLVGNVGQAQWFVRMLRAEADLYRFRFDRPMDVETLTTLVGSLIRRFEVTSINPLVGGVDENGPHLVTADPAGGVLADEFLATGSGIQVAYGHLEKQYAPGLSNEAAAEVAADAVEAASSRDTVSGDGIHVAEITTEGVDIYESRSDA